MHRNAKREKETAVLQSSGSCRQELPAENKPNVAVSDCVIIITAANSVSSEQRHTMTEMKTMW